MDTLQVMVVSSYFHVRVTTLVMMTCMLLGVGESLLGWHQAGSHRRRMCAVVKGVHNHAATGL